jgi:hypothetical protein
MFFLNSFKRTTLQCMNNFFCFLLDWPDWLISGYPVSHSNYDLVKQRYDRNHFSVIRYYY